MFNLLGQVKNYLAFMRLSKCNEVKISKNSRVEYRKIGLMESCQLEIGEHSIIEAQISFDKPGGSIKIGDRVFIGASHLICADRINIGNDVLISWGCNIVDHNSHAIVWKDREQDVTNWFDGRKDWSAVKTKSVKICDKAWLGFNVTVLKGVTIGEGAIVGASSVVTRDVAPYTIIAGNPAKVIREIPQNER